MMVSDTIIGSVSDSGISVAYMMACFCPISAILAYMMAYFWHICPSHELAILMGMSGRLVNK